MENWENFWFHVGLKVAKVVWISILREKYLYSEFLWSERYFVTLLIQFEYGENADQKNSAYRHFSRSAIFIYLFTYY